MVLFQLLILLGAPVIAFALYFTVFKSEGKFAVLKGEKGERKFSIGSKTFEAREFIFKSMGILLFMLLCVSRLFRDDAIHRQLGLDAAGALMSPQSTLIAVIVRWLGMIVVSMAILVPFFKKRELHDFMAIFGPVSVIASAIFLEESFLSASGIADASHWENVMFVLELLLTGVISFIELIGAIMERYRVTVKRVCGCVGHLLIYAIPFMPPWATGVLFGKFGDEPKDFSLEHRILLYFTFFVVFFFFIKYRKKPYDERLFAMIALSTSAFFSYFSIDRTALSMLPLHLCNTAIILILITYVFRLQGLFYFTYLVNVLGAVFAIAVPNTYTTLTEPQVILYWFDHIYAFALPILGVALNIFPKPQFKMVKKAIYVFTVYFVVIAFIDGWFNHASFNHTGETIDYFFLYSTFYLDKIPFARPLYQKWDIYINGQLIRLFPMYQIAVYVIFIAAMFGLWGFYTALYRVADDHRLLADKRKILRTNKLFLMKEMKGRPLSAPLNPKGENMIKIEHFTKIYNGSTRKAVEDVNLEVHAGEVFGFIGHNGAGKSTTIKSMVGIQSISEGRIEIEGYDIARQPLEAKMNIGYVSDNHAVYEKLTGREYVNYIADLYRVSAEDREARLKKYAAMFKLEEALDREIKGYSHGMKQKIMVISALIHDPKVWVLDEPLTGLDPTSSFQIKQCMREHADRGNIVFFSSHIIEVVERICDRIAIIADGKLRRCSSIAEIQASGKSLEQIYLQYIENPDFSEEAATDEP